MPEVIRDWSPEVLAAANEANFEAAMCVYVRHYSGSKLEEGPAFARYETGLKLPIANGLLRARLSESSVRDCLTETVARLKERGLPGMAVVGPGSRPATLGAELLAAGAVFGESLPGMSADLSAITSGAGRAPGVTVREVQDDHALEEWGDAAASGFEISHAGFRDLFTSPSKKLGFGVGSPVRNYLAYLDGKPVGTSTLCCLEGVAGIYCVATIEAARRRGVGSAVTVAPMLEARRLGYRFATLQASKMGFGVYEKLGFRTVCSFDRYFLNLEAMEQIADNSG